MTYDEIVQALRCCTDHSCSAKCPAYQAGLDCREEMHKAVLNLVESLTAENAGLRKEVAELREKVPQWISVEDADRRAPAGQRVIATDGVFVGEAYRTSADSWRRYDDYRLWYDAIGRTVTHWMLLPEAPKEEKA